MYLLDSETKALIVAGDQLVCHHLHHHLLLLLVLEVPIKTKGWTMEVGIEAVILVKTKAERGRVTAGQIVGMEKDFEEDESCYDHFMNYVVSLLI